VLPALEPTEEPVWSDAGSATSIANDRMEITFDERGSIVGLKLRAGRELIAGRANVIAKETDRGDLWEPYRSLDGGSRIAMTDRHPILADAVLSADLPPEVFRVRRGPVVSEVHVEGPLGEGRYATTVCLTQGLGRADVRTMVHNSERFVRYRAVVPTSIADGTRTDEIPFGAMERPDGIEFPAQNWIDWSDGTRGLAVLNRGLPGANVADGAMLLSLMRSTCIVAYGFGGGYEPGMSSDTGFELGATRAFEYALVPHGGDWRRAEVHRRGVELNHPLLTRKAAPSPGALPPESGLLAELPAALMVTSIRRVSGRQVALRLYEATGEPLGDTAIELSDGIAEAWETDLLGESAVALPVRAGRAIVSFRPFEIKALRLRSADAVRG
jgi:alpha-mannosidase